MIQWSQEYFTGLTYTEHVANNHWFNMMLKMLKDDGKLYVPMSCFDYLNTQGGITWKTNHQCN